MAVDQVETEFTIRFTLRYPYPESTTEILEWQKLRQSYHPDTNRTNISFM